MIRRTVLAVCLLLSPGAAAASLSCAQAAASAEAEAAIPPGLLLAIGLVESGRTDEAGQRAPWPWTVQAGGTGRFFASADEAVAAVDQLRAGGVQSIDIGCFQMNLYYHPTAFFDLAGGFDPLTNARAAAQFLTELHGERGTWEQAVAAYHSRSDWLGGPYRDLVYAAWQGPPVLRQPAAFGVHVWGPPGSPDNASLPAMARLPRIIVPTQSRSGAS